MEIVKDNPFAALFSSEDEILLRKKSVKRQLDELNALLARIFLVTLSGTVKKVIANLYIAWTDRSCFAIKYLKLFPVIEYNHSGIRLEIQDM